MACRLAGSCVLQNAARSDQDRLRSLHQMKNCPPDNALRMQDLPSVPDQTLKEEQNSHQHGTLKIGCICHNGLLVFKDLKSLLEPATQSMQKMLVEEKQTDALDKHYCPEDDCSKFVNKNSLADGVTVSACKRCGKKTCVVCRNFVRLPSHQKNGMGRVWNQ